MGLEGTTPEEIRWRQIIDDLREKLAEAEETLQAIAEYKVDAFVMGAAETKRVYTIKDSDHAYRVILDTINEGAATVGIDGTILYCNPAFAALLQLPVYQLIGASLHQYVNPSEISLFTTLIEQGLAERSRGELSLLTTAGTLVPVLLSCSVLRLDLLHCVCLVATDLTEQKRQAEIDRARTAELQATNHRLHQEIEERKQTEIALTEARQRLSQIRETERLLLARELHDGPLQEVIAMAFDLLLLAQTLDDDDQIAKVKALTSAVQKAAHQLRLVAQTLRPPLLAHLGLAAALRAHVKQVQETRETPTLRCVNTEETWSVPEETALALLRVMQQAVQNALQHAQANHIDVRLHYDDEWLRLEVEDDGRGFARPYNRAEMARAGHLGVVGMEERVEAIRGKFEVLSQPGKGTCIRVTVPKPPQQDEETFEEPKK